MLVAETPTDDKSRGEALIDDKARAEAFINHKSRVEALMKAKSRAEAPIDTAHRYQVMSGSSIITKGRFKVGFKVGFKVVSLFFWARGFLYFFMDGHSQAIVVLFSISLSQGFKEATMGISWFHFICFLLYGV
jgi:hypothetical protein